MNELGSIFLNSCRDRRKFEKTEFFERYRRTYVHDEYRSLGALEIMKITKTFNKTTLIWGQVQLTVKGS